MNVATPAVRKWTRREYDRFIEAGILTPEERVELINGETIEMSLRTSRHRTAVLCVANGVMRVFSQAYFIQVQMPIAAGDVSEPEPDVAVIAGDPRDYLDEHPSCPVLIVEVADMSLEYDRATKASVYAQASVEDYWVVNLVDENVEVYRGPSAMPHQPTGHGYKSRVIYMRGETIAPLAEPEGAVTVDDLLP